MGEEGSASAQTLGGRLTRHAPLFSHDSTLLYTSTGRTVRVFRVSDGRLIKSHALAALEKSCGLSRELKKALEACGQFWVCKPGLPCMDDITSLAWSEEHLVVSHFGGSVRFLDKEDLHVVREIFVDSLVLQVFVAGGSLFAFCASSDKQHAAYSELLRLSGDAFLPVFRHKGVGRISYCDSTAVFAFDRSFISICLADAKPVWTQRRHILPITAIAVKDGDTVLVGDTKGVITWYTLASKQRSLMHWHSSRVQALCFTSNYVLSGGLESVLVYWQDTERNFLPRLAQSGGIVDICVSPSELHAAVTVADNTVHIVNLSANLIEATLAGLKHRSTDILSVEPTRRCLVLVDSVRRGAMQLYDTQLDCGFEELDISPLPWISPVESTADSSDGEQQEHLITFTHAQYGRDAQQVVWLATTEQRHADIAAAQALKFWTVEVDGAYRLRTIIEDPHRQPIHSLRSCTLASEAGQGELVLLSSDADMCKIWRQVAIQRRGATVTSWCCSVALRARSILSADIADWRGFTLVAVVTETGVQVYEVLGTEVELACQLAVEGVVEVSIIDGCVVLSRGSSISAYAFAERDNKIELRPAWSMPLKNIVALCSLGSALAVLAGSRVFVYPNVAKPTHCKLCMPTGVQRIAFLSPSTLVGLASDAIVKASFKANDSDGRESDAVEQGDAGRGRPTAYAALNRNSVSLSSPPTSDTDVGGAAAAGTKAKKPRLRKVIGRKAANEEEALLRLTTSHELPPMESLFEHLLGEA